MQNYFKNLIGSIVKLGFSIALLSLSEPLMAGEDDTVPVRQALERLAQQSLPNLELSLVDEPTSHDWFSAQSKGGKAHVEGSSLSALAYGSYQYLRDIGALSVSWEGNRSVIPEQFPNHHITKTFSQVAYRVYLNVCAYGYTMPWWDWPRWQQEIDWMAVHGVNSPVAMEGQEYVWQQLWREFGVGEPALAEYFSGPAFTPWQRMGNIEGHVAPITQNWIDKKKNLQVKILANMRGLGMKPIAPAFGGYVPETFKQLFPKAKIYEMKPWTGFAKSTYWLDPKDPLFAKVAKRFIEIYTQTYGKSEFYLSDSFNEMLPPVDEANRHQELAAYGKYIYDSIAQAAPEATWVMQGWMFGADKEFWDAQSIQSFLSNVPPEKTMIHDIGNDRYAVWEGANGFYGKPWVFGFIHNYGASNPVYANFKFYQETFKHAYTAKNKGALSGYGVFPEGIHNNSVAYEYMFDLPWQNTRRDLSAWLETYSQARYGKSTPKLMALWSELEQAVYSTQYWSPRWWEGSAGAYLLFKRPEAKMTQFQGHPSDVQLLEKAVKNMLALQPEFAESSLYLYDLVDLFRHYVSLRIDARLQQTISLYQSGKIRKADAEVAVLKDTVKQLDLLLGLQQESVHSWSADASKYGSTPKQSELYIYNAKKQITTWGGPKLKDYASKAWQGMYKDFYWPRWQQFFDLLRKAQKTGKEFNQQQYFDSVITWEEHWAQDTSIPKLRVPKKPVRLMQSILKKLDG